MPLESLSAVARLRAITFDQFTFSPSNERPQVSASCPTFSYSSALARSALVGMQPQFRHTPPRLERSTHATFSPSCAARMAPT